MDSVSIVLVILLGAVVVWLVVRAFSNARHAPPRKHRGGPFLSGGSPGVASFGHVDEPRPPQPRRPGDESQ
jgi:hypothetical protein